MPRMRLSRVLFTRLQPKRRALLYLGLALVIVVFVPLIVSSGHWLRAPRVDLTADKLYTLAPGTVQIVGTLQRPIRLTLYFSEHATRDLPQLRSYEQRVHEMLLEMVARSHSRLRLNVIDPVPYSDDEASAQGSGLTAASGGSNGERVFFGLAGSALSGSAEVDGSDDRLPEHTLAIPFFDPDREVFLEYDIAKLLFELNQAGKPTIGVVSSLPMQGNPTLSQPPWTVMQQLGQLFNVRNIDPASLTHVDAGMRVLLLVQPEHLSADAQYAIDQYVLRGGHLVVFVDPDAELDFTAGTDSATGLPDPSSDLPRLFAAWGLVYHRHQVVLDRSRALHIELGGNHLDHPAMLYLDAQELNRDDEITASLQRINVSTAGYFDLAPNASTRLIPLMQTSADAEVVSARRVLAASDDPSELLQNYKPDNIHYVLAARLQGPFKSAFPERSKTAGYVGISGPHAQVVVVADTDLLSDRLWVEPETILGQTMKQVFANNGDFITNMADNLSGSSELLSIRGRSTSQRPFTRVDRLRHVANQKFLQKEHELKQELADTRKRLDELQPGKGGQNSTVTAEQRREIEQFRQRQLAINKELREVQHQLNAEIDVLGLRLKFINIVVVPVLVVLIGLLYGWRRTRRSRRRR